MMGSEQRVILVFSEIAEIAAGQRSDAQIVDNLPGRLPPRQPVAHSVPQARCSLGLSRRATASITPSSSRVQPSPVYCSSGTLPLAMSPHSPSPVTRPVSWQTQSPPRRSASSSSP